MNTNMAPWRSDSEGESEEYDVSPFGVSDFVQLAGMSGRSVVLDIQGGVVGRGTIIIYEGSLWSARDERGSGLGAFRRLVFLSDVVVRCHPVSERDLEIPRMLDVSCESALLDAARIQDESGVARRILSSIPPRNAAEIDRAWEKLTTRRPPADSRTRPTIHPTKAPEGPFPKPSRVPTALSLSRATETTTEDEHTTRADFARLYEAGVDALLRKRFVEAYAAFRAADVARPGDSRVIANIKRLEQMGYKP